MLKNSTISTKITLVLLVFSTTLLLVNSCKKTDRVENPIENAKTWYLNTIDKVQLRSGNGTSQPIDQEIDWMTAKSFKDSAGKDIVCAVATMKIGKGQMGGSYMLFIYRSKEGAYTSHIAWNAKKRYFEDHISDSDLMTVYNEGLKVSNDQSKRSRNKNLMSAGCTDWYLVTTYYNSWGDVIGSTSRFLYTSCFSDPNSYPEPDLGGPVDCAGMLAGGAYLSDCGCIGGTTGITACPNTIQLDTSVINNPKINCLLRKLLGLDNNNPNPEFTALLNAFKGKGFDVIFKIGTTKPTSWGETSEDPNNPTKYNIVLNRNRINEGYQMDWVKTLLHEAFHANLLQKTYELFGASAIALWDKNPGNMSFNELMDYVSMKAQTSGNPVLKAEHHNFMARNFEIIRDGLKSFSLTYNPNHADYNNFHFDALAYQGLTDTSYYLNNVIKNPDGSLKTVEVNGHQLLLEDVNNRFYIDLIKENMSCN